MFVLSHSIVSDPLQACGLQTTSLCPRGFSRQEYWSGLPCPPPGDLPNPGIKHRSHTLQGNSLPSEPRGKPNISCLGNYQQSGMFKAGLPSCLSVKELTCQCGRSGFDPGIGKTPWRRKWQPIPVFLPGKSHGQRNLVCYSPWDGKRVGHELATKQ